MSDFLSLNPKKGKTELWPKLSALNRQPVGLSH